MSVALRLTLGNFIIRVNKSHELIVAVPEASFGFFRFIFVRKDLEEIRV